MAIVDVVVIPLNEKSVSVSEYIADIQLILKDKKEAGLIDYQLTPMSTLIEGELADLLEVIGEIHEAPFNKGVKRVCTNIRIDDRRDISRKMNDKLDSVNKHLK
ncbi:MTH1187 family thiamine-binding protein [Macrococcus carouselicus]|uniref:MTH1187 family thiamine-binding protein n=1 Tax=Macrococcus carouselicus TaxID=69969 RepID=A0A9Q8CLK9_9STAP|nr:MTH1187 family thiamine-binding protein [Macrococcus carouselicus]TDM04346.1 MTH1187 family thiamine-binding protein [Macrococcus carouselicus]